MHDRYGKTTINMVVSERECSWCRMHGVAEEYSYCVMVLYNVNNIKHDFSYCDTTPYYSCTTRCVTLPYACEIP